jgi:DNA polymerase I-like protein with 3'-5' exonuclease and polymerase domains
MGNSAAGFKLALIHIAEKLKDSDARIVHTQHDEIIVKVREDSVDQVRVIVEESMEESLKRIVPKVPFAVEIGMAAVWG